MQVVSDLRDSAQLAYSEANPLAAALVSRLAAERGIRTLIIKGLSLEHHGLRPGYVSCDIDVFVDPAHLDELLSAIMDAGWQLRETTMGDRLMTRHSVTVLNPAWPNDIDLHSVFPGLLAGPQASFEVLWASREPVMLGGCPCWIPDRASAMVIWAAHSLRGSVRQSRHDSELRQLVAEVLPGLSGVERRQLADRIVELGADRPLGEVPEFAALVGDRRGPQAEGEWEAWRSKVAQQREVTPWLQVLRDARPRELPRLVARAIWPSAHDLLVLEPSAVDTPLGRVQARLRRMGRVLRRLVER